MYRITSATRVRVYTRNTVLHVAARTLAGLQVSAQSEARRAADALRSVTCEAELPVCGSTGGTEVLVRVEIEIKGGATGTDLLVSPPALNAVKARIRPDRHART